MSMSDVINNNEQDGFISWCDVSYPVVQFAG